MSSSMPTLAQAAPAATPSVRNLPVSLFGSVMGLAGLALAWRAAAAGYGAPAFIGEAIGALATAVFLLLATAYAAKSALWPDAVRQEFGHPVSGNFFGTIAIALLLVSAVIGPYSPAAGRALWLLGVLATFVLSYLIVSRLLRGSLDGALAVPAWLIPGVATLDITVTGAAMAYPWARQLNLFAMGVGAVLALVLFTLIVGRLVHREPLAPAMRPTLMILVAPFAVGFLAYTGFTGRVDAFAALLYFFALFLFAVLAPRVLGGGVPFTAAWWAISFPLAALVNAALRYAEAVPGWPLTLLAGALLVFVTGALAVLVVRTAMALFTGQLLGRS